MQILQVRTTGDREEGEYDDYYNYEFCLLGEDQHHNFRENPDTTWVDFNGSSRYPRDLEEYDEEYIEDRTDWGIPTRELRVII